MTTVIRLDSNALAALIEADPNFKLELQRGVSAEIVRKVIIRDAGQILRAFNPKNFADALEDATVQAALIKAVDSALAASLRGGWNTPPALKPEIVEQIKATAARTAVTAVQQLAVDKVAELQPELELIVEERVKSRINGEIRTQVEAQVKQRLDAVMTGLSQ